MTFEKNTNLNPAICHIRYAFVEEIESLVEYSADEKAISFKEPNVWKDLYFSPKSAKFSEEESEMDAGILYSQVLTASFPGDKKENRSAFHELISRKLLISIEYSSGDKRLIGSLENWAIAQVKQAGSNEKTVREIQFSCLSSQPSWWLAA